MDAGSPYTEGSQIATISAALKSLQSVENASYAARISELNERLLSGKVDTLVDVLPVLLHLKGKPYELSDHLPFEDLFRFRMPSGICYKTGRQVSKTTSLAADGVIKANSIEDFTTIYVTPLFEQVRRFSAMFVAPFIKFSPVKQLWSDTTTTNSVLHRSFKNRSQMIFSFAFLDADRIRGVSADRMAIDEVQDMNHEFIPIIQECMSHSDWSIRQFTGTPKTLDNTLQGIWDESSMAEWFIPCTHCTTNGYHTWNIPSMDHHLEKMIGPYHEGISEKSPATICYKCGQPISPRLGRWVHRKSDPATRWDLAGYHVPQIIMPLHYAKPRKWSELLGKQQGRGGVMPYIFYNEVLGESYDVSTKLVTQTELQAACEDRPNTIEHARKMSSQYKLRVLAIDWGGGGEKGISLTVPAVLGLRYDGKIDVLYSRRLLTPHDHIQEAMDILELYRIFKPHIVAHDYTGAGSLRETFMIQAGIPLRNIMPCMYVRSAASAPCKHVNPTAMHPRHHYRVDKTRSLLLTCAMIKLQRMSLFKYDHINKSDPGLCHDFLGLIEDKVATAGAGEIYRITKAAGAMDDFAQAVNIGCVAIWHRTKSWPNLPELRGRALTDAQVAAAGPSNVRWSDQDEGDDELI